MMDFIYMVLLISALAYIYYIVDKSKDPNSSNKTIDSQIKENEPSDTKKVGRKILKIEELDKLLFFNKSYSTEGVYLVFDLETTGLIKKKSAIPEYEPEKFPYVVQISWLLFDKNKCLIEKHSYYIKQNKKIPASATAIYNITDELVTKEGVDVMYALKLTLKSLSNCKIVICHNLEFDWNILRAEFARNGLEDTKNSKYLFCTMEFGKDICKIPNYGGYKRQSYKFPTLQELFRHYYFSNVKYFGLPNVLHNSEYDTAITAKCFFKMRDVDNVISHVKL